MDKEDVTQIHIQTHRERKRWNIIQHEGEGNLVICNNMDGPEGIMLSEMSQTEKNKYCMIYLYMEIF